MAEHVIASHWPVQVMAESMLSDDGTCLGCGGGFPHPGTCAYSIMHTGVAWVLPSQAEGRTPDPQPAEPLYEHSVAAWEREAMESAWWAQEKRQEAHERRNTRKGRLVAVLIGAIVGILIVETVLRGAW